ncbi:MAG TPA: hypothetical protein VMW75_26310, partial [Thermoanaerobaculia bacterium]|nr:hypothetical protein [Thermoanaerobaculia bacterium]
MTATTILEFLSFLSAELAGRDMPPPWPPDAFGLAAALLMESGAYLSVVSKWPNSGIAQDGFLEGLPEEWCGRIADIGSAWRQSWDRGSAPEEIAFWWKVVRSHSNLTLGQISANKSVFCALLQICAAADEACTGVGLVAEDRFGIASEVQLLPNRKTGSTLCKEIDPSKLRVLPKFHTPQTGLSLRSLSHHLALWTSVDATPLWFTVTDPEEPHSLSLLLIPWPTAVTPRQFVPAEPHFGSILNMPKEGFGFFSYHHKADPEALGRLQRIYHAAEELTGRVDGVVLPELAVDEIEYQQIRDWVTGQKSLLIAGVGAPSEGVRPGKNRVAIDVPTARVVEKGKGHRVSAFQNKHHRWRLDRSQIVQYGLGGQLDPSRRWWEHIEVEARRLVFLSLQPWLSICALVCEDLARQEPVARLVRAVGPNLVIALLMDGPQLASRWPARYATVLADDPGSSVLTFTSIGMCEFSRPAGRPPSR